MVLDAKLSKGDWIVHANYGLGQVQGEDTKVLEGEKNHYYVVQTEMATYWLPKDRLDADNIRDIAPVKLFRQALQLIEEKPRQMNQDFRKRQSRIVEVIASNSVVELAKLIRDLYWRRKHKNLNENEKRALDIVKERFAREWSVAADLKQEETRSILEKTLASVALKYEEE